MKLAAGYIVFDGLETLEASLRSVRSQVDQVIVSYQTVSWTGTQAQPDQLSKLKNLQKLKLIDQLIEFSNFKPVAFDSADKISIVKGFELAKRQSCLTLARELGMTHYISMDADECYRSNEFSLAKFQIIKDNLDATAVHYINYVTPTLHRGYSRWLVPFIYRITPRCAHYPQQEIFFGVDPTRGVFDPGYFRAKVFESHQISMHHMELVRTNILHKYESSSRFFPDRGALPQLAQDIIRAKFTKQLQFTKAHFGDSDNPREIYKLTECPNEFGITV